MERVVVLLPRAGRFKIPLGIGAVGVIALLSVIWVRPRYKELPLAICGLAWTGSLMTQSVNIGIRHFLSGGDFLADAGVARCGGYDRAASTALTWCV